MTSKLTRLTDDELTETLRQATSGYPLPASVEGNLRHAFAELQERRKADSEPVAWTDEEELRDVNVAGIGYLFGIDREANKFADPRRKIMLYRHAQPAPVVTFYRDGIEAAAKWIDQQREAYDSEHGWSDPGTGSFEFGNDAQREYSSTLEELAEGIRSLHPNAGNSPVIPDGYVMVPAEPNGDMLAAAQDAYGETDGDIASTLRAAMLAAAQQSPGREPATVPGKWIPVSEQMPEDRTQVILWDAEIGEVTSGHYSHKTHTFYHCGDAIQNEITHWMLPPSAPQEVKGE